MSTQDPHVPARDILGSVTRNLAEILRMEREFAELDWPKGPISTRTKLPPNLTDTPLAESPNPRPSHNLSHGAPSTNVPYSAPQAKLPQPNQRPSTLIHPIRSDLFRDVPRGADGLRVVRDEMGDCQRCKLHKGRKNLVFGVGNPMAELMFVGEGPGADEDTQGIPFVGKAGQLLTRQITAMGYTRDDVYIANIVKCRPPDNRDPEPDERLACGPFVLGQIRAVSPKVIVALGRIATQALLETAAPIGALRGKWHTHPHISIPVMPTYHPAALLRADNLRRYVWEDLKQVMAFLGKPIPGR